MPLADPSARARRRRRRGAAPGARRDLAEDRGPRPGAALRAPRARGAAWAAVLTSPAGALGSWTALEVHGLRGWERDVVHVVVPAGRGRRRAPGARLSSSTRCADVRTRRGLPVHDVARAAVDAGGSCAGPRSAGGLVAAVVQQRLTTVARIRAEVLAAGPVRHRAVLRAVLDDVEGGSGSLAEVDLARLCRVAGLPVPLRQQVREDGSGRRRYLDAEWLLPDGRRLLLEVHGVGHVEKARWYDDLPRAAEVAQPGEVLLRLLARALRADAARVVAVLRRHLQE